MQNIEFYDRFNKLIVFWFICNGNKEIGIKKKLFEALSILKKLIKFRRNNFATSSIYR